MRRELRPLLPAFSRIYNLTGDDLIHMPKAEREAYIDDLDAITTRR